MSIPTEIQQKWGESPQPHTRARARARTTSSHPRRGPTGSEASVGIQQDRSDREVIGDAMARRADSRRRPHPASIRHAVCLADTGAAVGGIPNRGLALRWRR